MEKKTKCYYFYVLQCCDQTLYSGFTVDLEKRLKVHNQGKGAKYTRARRPVKLIYHECFSTKRAALQKEYAFKQLKRKQKLKYLHEQGIVIE